MRARTLLLMSALMVVMLGSASAADAKQLPDRFAVFEIFSSPT